MFYSLCELKTKNLSLLIQEDFEGYAQKAKTLPENTTNENMLILYGLYKQATVGNVNTSESFLAGALIL